VERNSGLPVRARTTQDRCRWKPGKCARHDPGQSPAGYGCTGFCGGNRDGCLANACDVSAIAAGGETREEGRGKREEGRGKREEGRGKREEGRGKREEGRGKREEERVEAATWCCIELAAAGQPRSVQRLAVR